MPPARPGSPPRSPDLETWLAAHPGKTRLYYDDLADLMGVPVTSLRRFLARSRAHRRDKQPSRGDMPEPDGYDPPAFQQGARPWWAPGTAGTWLDTRPGVSGKQTKLPPG